MSFADLDNYTKIIFCSHVSLDDYNSLLRSSKQINTLCNNSFHTEALYRMRCERSFLKEALKIKSSEIKWKEFYQRIIIFLKTFNSAVRDNSLLNYIYCLFKYNKYVELKFLICQTYVIDRTKQIDCEYKFYFTKMLIRKIFQAVNFELMQWVFSVHDDKDFSMRDLLMREYLLYNIPAIDKNVHIFKFLSERKMNLLTQKIANCAAHNGAIKLLTYMSKLNPPILPTQDLIDELIGECTIGVLQFMIKLSPPIRPTRNTFISAIEYGNIKLCKWLLTLPYISYPTTETANFACRYSNIRTLKWLTSLPNPVFPNKEGALETVKYESNNNVAVLKWMSTLSPPISIDQEIYELAFDVNNLKVIKWMATLSPPFLPNRHHLMDALNNQDINLLKFILKANPKLRSEQTLIRKLIKYDQKSLIVYLSELSPPILPTLKDISWAIVRSITKSMYNVLDCIMPEGIEECIEKITKIERHQFYLKHGYAYVDKHKHGYNRDPKDNDVCDCDYVDICTNPCPCQGENENSNSSSGSVYISDSDSDLDQ